MVSKKKYIKILQKYCASNKLKGVLAEQHFSSFSEEHLHEGCWVLAPSHDPFDKHAFFHRPPDKAVSDLLLNSHIKVFYYEYNKTKKIIQVFDLDGNDAEHIFESWRKGNPREFKSGYDPNPSESSRMNKIPLEDLYSMSLKQHFLYNFLRNKKRLIFAAHDLDAFYIDSYKRAFFVEIREKYPAKEGWFGIDIMKMVIMAKLGGGLYIIRSIKDKETRRFSGFLAASYTDIINNCEWSHYTGSSTSFTKGAAQTIKIKNDIFKKIKTKEDFYEFAEEKV